MQETQVWSLLWEDYTCHRATKPVPHNYWSPSSRAHELQPLSPHTTITEPRVPHSKRSHQNEKPMNHSRSLQLEKASVQQQRPSATKKNNYFLKQIGWQTLIPCSYKSVVLVCLLVVSRVPTLRSEGLPRFLLLWPLPSSKQQLSWVLLMLHISLTSFSANSQRRLFTLKRLMGLHNYNIQAHLDHLSVLRSTD